MDEFTTGGLLDTSMNSHFFLGSAIFRFGLISLRAKGHSRAGFQALDFASCAIHAFEFMSDFLSIDFQQILL